jgi:hypothetical protein
MSDRETRELSEDTEVEDLARDLRKNLNHDLARQDKKDSER